MKRRQPTGSKRAYPKMWEYRDGRRKLGVYGFVACLAVVAMAAVLSTAYQLVRQWDFFLVTGVKLEGGGRVSKSELLELGGLNVPTNIMAMDVKQVEERLGHHEWIETVTVERQWPNQVIIRVQEKKPVAMAEVSGEYYYLDRTGFAFAKISGTDDLDYPIVSGMAKEDWQEGQKIVCLREALSFIGKAGHKRNTTLPQQNISEIHVGHDGKMILFLASRPFPIYLGSGNISDQYGKLVKVLSRLYQEDKFTRISYIRMDYQPGKVLVGLSESVS